MLKDRVIVFDLDDTLFLEKDFVFSGFSAVSQWMTSKFKTTDFYAQCVNLYLSGIKKNVFDIALNKLNINYESKLIEQLVEIYRLHKPNINLLADAAWAIKYLHNKCSLAILTDGYLEAQKNKVDALGIENFFDFIMYSDINGKAGWKPSKLPYLSVMEYFSCNGHDCVYIADNVLKDFITAKELGWQTICICREQGEYASVIASDKYYADHKIHSLYELSGGLLK